MLRAQVFFFILMRQAREYMVHLSCLSESMKGVQIVSSDAFGRSLKVFSLCTSGGTVREFSDVAADCF